MYIYIEIYVYNDQHQYSEKDTLSNETKMENHQTKCHGAAP